MAPTNTALQEPDDFNVQAFIDGLPRALTPEERIELVKKDVQSGNVFFYPASALDWQPILGFHGKFSTFIYCDWAVNLQDFEQGNHARWQMQPVRNGALHFKYANAIPISARELGGVEVEMADFLTAAEQESRQSCYEAQANKQPWGRLLDVAIEREDRKIQLVFLCAEGVKTYLELFSAPRHAPQFLSIKGPGTGFGFNWTDFRCYQEALGRAVQNNPNKPARLGADQSHDWPWTDDDGKAGGMIVFKRPR